MDKMQSSNLTYRNSLVGDTSANCILSTKAAISDFHFLYPELDIWPSQDMITVWY